MWFPAPWPETYSYTLSAALTAGLPVVATRIGAFPERLADRPLTWVVEPTLDVDAWRATFQTVAETLRRHDGRNQVGPVTQKEQPASPDFYADNRIRTPHPTA